MSCADHPRECGANSLGSASLRPDTDHPRECGANRLPLRSAPPANGSSPRVRGKRLGPRRRSRPRRIIPASAGQTRSGVAVWAFIADHPRECGANRLVSCICWSMAGSSPRVRGKLIEWSFPHAGLRIIPASAGQTSGRVCRSACRPDHPRECGANVGASLACVKFDGSSPRVRGKHQHH